MKSTTQAQNRGAPPKELKGVSGEQGRPFAAHLTGVLRRLRAAFGGWPGEPEPPAREDLNPMPALCRKALALQGEVSGIVVAAQAADTYLHMTGAERLEFFQLLATEFSAEPSQVETAAQAYLAGQGARVPEITALKASLESPRLGLFRLFNTLHEGIKFLIDMRADLLAQLAKEPNLIGVEYDLRDLLASWFNIGFLKLERVTWDTSASVLEKLIRYEAVHQIAGWEDLKNRLTSDRTAFAFFHPAMAGEPVIFVEAAIVKGMADNIQTLMHPATPPAAQEADTAIFYSISNAQKGLRGIPLGNFLIKQVLAKLRTELPHLSTFATLSPMPRLRRAFLEPELARGGLGRFFPKLEAAALCEVTRETTLEKALAGALSGDGWVSDEQVSQALRPGMLRAAREYLTEGDEDGTAPCPVGHFHASNGALLGRINWLADTSPKGLRQSMGMMVNYVYEPELFEQAQADYVQSGRMTLTQAVQNL